MSTVCSDHEDWSPTHCMPEDFICSFHWSNVPNSKNPYGSCVVRYILRPFSKIKPACLQQYYSGTDRSNSLTPRVQGDRQRNRRQRKQRRTKDTKVERTKLSCLCTLS